MKKNDTKNNFTKNNSFFIELITFMNYSISTVYNFNIINQR